MNDFFVFILIIVRKAFENDIIHIGFKRERYNENYIGKVKFSKKLCIKII